MKADESKADDPMNIDEDSTVAPPGSNEDEIQDLWKVLKVKTDATVS